MKILLLTDDYPPRGQSSVATIVEGLADGLSARGHAVTVLTSHGEGTDQVFHEGNVISLARPVSLAQVKDVIGQLKPNVVHAHNIHTFMGYDILEIAKNYSPRVFITLHDVMSFSYSRLNTQRYLDNDDARWKLIDHLKRAKWRYRPLRNRRIRLLFRENVTKIFAVSHALQKALAANGITNVEVVHNGIDAKAWHASKEAIDAFRKKNESAGRKTILFGGRLSMDKGSGPILQALRRLSKDIPSVLLLVVGDPRRWQKLVEAAGATDLSDQYKVLGWLDHEQMKTATLATDIVTVPSVCLDCFPTLNLEAMAAKKPIVGTIFGGTPETVENGVTGFVCDPRDIDTYTSHLQRLLSDENLRHSMGEAGYGRVQKECTIEKQIDRYVEQYEMKR